MNYAAATNLAAAAVALFAGALSYRLRVAPAWRHHRWFALAAAAAACFALGSFVNNSGFANRLVAPSTALQVSLAFVQVWSWLRYVDGYVGHTPGRWARRWRAAYLSLAIPGVVAPGLLFDPGSVTEHAYAGGAFVCRDARATPVGAVLVGMALAGSVPLLVRLLKARRAGVRLAGLHVVAIGTLVVMALNDAANALGLLSSPYLLDVGFVLPIAAVATASTRRFVQEARELEELWLGLEATVADRVHELSVARTALHEAEQLAALGHFAAGIAHEINNPAAAVAVNLRFIAEKADPGPGQASVRAAAAEGTEAMNRMTAVVRRLAEVGRIVSRTAGGDSCDLADPVERAVEDVASRFPGGRIRFEVGPLAGLRPAASEPDVHHAVHALLLNAAEAMPEGRGGEVVVAAREADGRVEVSVEDDGAGLDDEALARAFEPFYSTKRAGRGTGLGLTVARALVGRHGGQLRLERREGRGARALLTLPARPRPTAAR